MIDFSFPIYPSYNERRKKSILLITLVSGGLLAFSLLFGNDLLIASSILFLVLLIQLYKSSKADRFFIKNLKIKNDDVQVIYEDKGNEIILAGKLEVITIKKETEFRTIYLAIYKNNILLVQQFIKGEWTEEKFDEIEQCIRKYNILGKEIW